MDKEAEKRQSLRQETQVGADLSSTSVNNQGWWSWIWSKTQQASSSGNCD